jgi:cbb3-type cytochrome oxidase subunit 3
MELETYVYLAQVGTVVLLVMSAIVVIGTIVAIYRSRRRARKERSAHAASS